MVRIIVPVLFLLACLRSSALAIPTVSHWLGAANGVWTDGSKWSTSPNYPDNGRPNAADTYSARIDSLGAPYTVSLVGEIEVSDLTIDSANATLAVGSTRLETPNINIVAGTLRLGVSVSGFPGNEAQIVGATITGSGNVQINAAREVTPVFDGVTLGVDTFVPPTGGSPPGDRLVLRNGLTIMEDHALRIGGLVTVEGTQAIQGSGEVVLEGGIRLAENTMLTIGPDVTIRTGTVGGVIGYRDFFPTPANTGIINEGHIIADAADRDLVIISQPHLEVPTFENRGVVEAAGSGRVRLNGDWTNNGVFRLRGNGRLDLGGTFQWSDVGLVDRQGGEIRVGGIVQNAGNVITANSTFGSLTLGGVDGSPTQIIGGTLAAADGEAWRFINGEITNVTLATDIAMPDHSSIHVYGDLTLDNATIRLFSNDDLSTNSTIQFVDPDPQAIRGQGTIQFAEGRVNSVFPGSGLTIGEDVVVESIDGHGGFGQGRLINEGTIRSGAGSILDVRVQDLVNRGTIEVAGATTIGRDPESTWRNEGRIRIKPNGRLTLFGTFSIDDLGTLIDEGAAAVTLAGVLNNTGRTLNLDDLNLTVPLSLNGGEIRGGVLRGSADALEFIPNISFLNGVTLASDFTIAGGAGGARVHVTNGLTLDHVTLTVVEGATLVFGATQTLGGTGTILAPNEPFTGAITTIGGEELVIGENITIRNGTEAFRELVIGFKENRGTIISEAPNTLVNIGENISLSVGPTWTNNGIIRVVNGTLQFRGNYSVDHIGTLEFEGGEVVLQGNLLNQGKTIRLDPSTGGWKFRGTVHGGRIETSGGAIADVAGTFDNVTLAGEAVLFDEFSSTATGALSISNGLTFDGGTLTIERFGELHFNDHGLLDGRGHILLNAPLQAAQIEATIGGQITIGPNIAIRTGPNGAGSISGSTLPIVNQGTISAETRRQTLFINGPLQNTGLLQARNGSALLIESDNWIHQGIIHLEEGTVVCRSGSVINGPGALISGRGIVEFQQTQFINRGTIAPTGLLEIRGSVGLESTSVLEIDLGGAIAPQFDALKITGDVSLAGQLDVSLGNDYQLRLNQRFTVVDILGLRSGEFDGLQEGAVVGNFGGKDLFITYAGGSGNDVVLFTAVPEPNGASLALLAIAIAVSRVRPGMN
jgi:hypothetical protein